MICIYDFTAISVVKELMGHWDYLKMLCITSDDLMPACFLEMKSKLAYRGLPKRGHVSTTALRLSAEISSSLVS